jgi:glycosyltransferase involved in cell wall biosynthesis
VLPHKGALVFEEVVRRLPAAAAPELRWSAYGGGDAELLRRLRRLPRVRVRGYYRSGSLVDRLRRDRVDLALLLSIVPESYSLALSECMAAGVPVAAFDQGAIAERIRRHGGGLLVPPEAGADGIVALLREISREKLTERSTASPAGAGAELPAATVPGDAADAAGAFQAIYRELGLS